MEKNINNEIRHYSIKCTVGDQIRRFRIEGTNKQELYEALCEEVKTNDGVQIYWTDDEDDQCVLNSAADLDEAVQQAQNNIVRMYVKETKSTQGAAAPVTITPVQTDAVSGINPMGQRPLDAHHRDVGAVHNATCDLCDCCIIGHRFICLECDDYDLCASCESTSAHYEHVMMRIVDPNTTKIPWGTKVFQNVHRIHRSLEKKTADEKLKDLAKNSVQAISEVGSFIAAALNDFGIETTYEVRNGGQRCGTRKETSAPATPVTPAAPVSATVPVVSQETPVLVEVKVEEKKEAPAVQKAEKKELTQEDKTTVATVMENLLNDVQKKGREFRAAVEQKKQEGVKEKQARKAEVIKILDEKKKAAKQTTEESPFAQVKSDGPPGFATREKPFRYRDDESDLGANSFGSGNGSARRFGRPTARGGFGAASGVSSSRGYSRGFVNEPRNTFERPGFSQSGFQNKEEAFGYQSNFGDNRNSFGGCDFGGGSRFGSGRGFESSRGGFGNDGFANGGGSNKNSFEQPGFGQSGFPNREEEKQQTGIGGNSSFGGSGFGSGQEFEISPQAVFGANSDSFGNSRGGFGSKPTGFGSVAPECGFGSGSFENKSSGFGGFENKPGAFGSGSRFGKPRHPYSERTRADFGTRPRYSFEYGPEFEDSDDDGWGLGSGHSDHHGFGAPSFESPKKSSFGGDSSFSFGAVKGEKSTSVFEQPRPVKYSADDKKAPEEFAPPPPTQLKKEKTPEEEKIDEIKKEEIKKNASRTNKEFYKMVQQKVKQDVAPEAQEAEDDKLVVIDPDQESIGSDIVTFPEDCDSDGWVDAAEKAASERVKEVSAAPAYPKLDETVVELMPETNQANNIEVDKTLAALISFGYSDTQARRAISHCGCDIENCLDYITLQE